MSALVLAPASVKMTNWPSADQLVGDNGNIRSLFENSSRGGALTPGCISIIDCEPAKMIRRLSGDQVALWASRSVSLSFVDWTKSKSHNSEARSNRPALPW